MDNVAVHQASLPAKASDALCQRLEWMLTLTGPLFHLHKEQFGSEIDTTFYALRNGMAWR
jgi:hypothetical protein